MGDQTEDIVNIYDEQHAQAQQDQMYAQDVAPSSGLGLGPGSVPTCSLPSPSLETYSGAADLEGTLVRGESLDLNRLAATLVDQMRRTAWLMDREMARFEAEQGERHEAAEAAAAQMQREEEELAAEAAMAAEETPEKKHGGRRR